MRLTELYSHPLKSCRGNLLQSARIDALGIEHDRRWMLADEQGKFLTGRQHPRLVLIEVAADDAGATFSAPGMQPLRVEHAQMRDGVPAEVWGNAFQARAGSDEADFWFSNYLGSHCRLLYTDANTSRRAKRAPSIPVGFADGYPLLLVGRASLDDLNSRLAQPVGIRQFRSNLLVDTAVAFEEDTWQRIRIGEVEFEHVKPCTRCIFITIDPDSAVPAPDRQPLLTLAGYRRFDDGTRFGINLIALNQGRIQLGDTVEVLA
ncbi:MOSC domain-containing protein [Chitinimonas sp.]|uniref:MOSC domain-containing protein n=1 Tax=Chitinimonas sp. TaxID=1934313 RepID=UPI0035AF5908